MNRSTHIFHPWLAAIGVFVLLALLQQTAKGIAIDQSNTYDALNRLSGAGSNGYSYDAAGNMLQITGGVQASLAVLPTSATVPDTAQTGLSFAVTATGAWTAASDQGWLTLTTSSGAGNGNVTFNATQNSTGSLRTAHVTVTSGALTATYTLSQLAPPPPPPPLVPTATSLAATSITGNTATFSGTANPNGTSATAYFEYGLDTGYGASTASVGIGTGTAAVPVNFNATGLGGSTTYHYRLVATNTTGTTNGADVTFTTLTAPSNNASLSGLSPSTGKLNPAFASGTGAYSASVPNATTAVTVTPTVAQVNATVKINGTTVASGAASVPIALNVGVNVITTVVTAQDGTTTQDYTLTVTRASLLSNNANLASLVPSAGTLSPTFVSGTFNYTATVPKSAIYCTVTPTVEQAGATVMVNGSAVTSGSASGYMLLNIGSNNIINTIVTAPDGTTTQTYTLTVTRLTSWRDMNTDGNADILFQNNLGQIAVWYMDGAGAKIMPPVYLSTIALGDWRVKGVADMNGDGNSDIVFQNDVGQIAVWYLNGSGVTTSYAYLYTNGLGDWRVVGVGDLNGDGNADILFQNNIGQIAVWYLNGSGVTTSSAYLYSGGLGDWRVAGIADMNGDGNADFIFQNNLGQIAVWYLNGSGGTISSAYLYTSGLGDWRIR